MTPLVSFVTGTFNRLPMLQKLFASIRSQMPLGMEYEFCICDGGSNDGSVGWLKTQSDVILIEDHELTGAISAFTRAAHKATGKYVLLLNDDVEMKPNSIIPAIVHLENNMLCGIVAYKDNRPVGNYTKNDYKTLQMEGNLNGKRIGIIYAQVGMVRRWLGASLNWWSGEHDEMVSAKTYGADNSLSAQCWNKGYTVDEVPECIVEDHVANDELREINYRKGLDSNDSHFFYDQWPNGVIVNNEPQIPQQDRRAARILYLPIYEPGWAVQKHPVHGKHGLRDALSRGKNKYGANHIVQEFDYLEASVLYGRLDFGASLIRIAETFKPDLILTQLQSPLPLTADMLSDLKQRTGATVVNWNGDQAVGGLYSPQLLPILRQIDLQLITNLEPAVVDNYESQGIKWAYWQIGYEESADDEHTASTADSYYHELGRESPFISDVHWPVSYLASLRSPERVAIAEVVKEFGGRVFSPGDEFASLYNFSVTKEIYRRSKVIISDNGFTSRGFVSNRLFQALASGGGVVLQQHVDGLDELTGLFEGTHYIGWKTLDDLRILLKRYQSDDEYNTQERLEIASDGTTFVRENFSFDAQVAKLMKLIKERLGESEQLANSVALKYIGRNPSSFGLGNSYPSGMRYEYSVGKLLYVKPEDLSMIMAYYPNEWQRMEV